MKSKCLALHILAGMIILFLLAGAALTQTQTASLTGLVKDPSGAVVPGARIVTVNLATGSQSTTQTNKDGYYTFPLLPPGSYRLTVEKAGFEGVVRSGIQLDVQETARIDFTLHVGATLQQVTVSAAAPLLQKETSSISQLVSQREVANLPLLGRNPYALVQVVPPGFFGPIDPVGTLVERVEQAESAIQGGCINLPWRGIVTRDGWKYACLPNTSWLLFNLDEDPYEQVNMAHYNKYRVERKKLIARLKQWISDTGDTFEVPEN